MNSIEQIEKDFAVLYDAWTPIEKELIKKGYTPEFIANFMISGGVSHLMVIGGKVPTIAVLDSMVDFVLQSGAK
jgi:hypothetical protein